METYETKFEGEVIMKPIQIKDANKLLEQYPKLKVKNYVKFLNMDGDLFAIGETGKIIRIKRGIIWESKKGSSLEVKEFELIDGGGTVEGGR